ncbi:hypothetical protein [Absidia glauca]|uniref:Ndc10 domain-containing protein n=1 Tax=Absidia glauca TaxID=4829 RepID=A0A163MNT4_ABSGL|nr:hypothetical protein [Absidia glauca]
MEQHNDKRRISHQPSKRIGTIHGRLPHIWSILLSCTCYPQPTYQPLQEVVPGDLRMTCRLAAKELSPGDPIQPTVAENAFVQVIMMFRKTFIQDSVLMMELHPCYPIWQHLIFSDPVYLPFER